MAASINNRAATRREKARQSDGKFGQQPRPAAPALKTKKKADAARPPERSVTEKRHRYEDAITQYRPNDCRYWKDDDEDEQVHRMVYEHHGTGSWKRSSMERAIAKQLAGRFREGEKPYEELSESWQNYLRAVARRGIDRNLEKGNLGISGDGTIESWKIPPSPSVEAERRAERFQRQKEYWERAAEEKKQRKRWLEERGLGDVIVPFGGDDSYLDRYQDMEKDWNDEQWRNEVHQRVSEATAPGHWAELPPTLPDHVSAHKSHYAQSFYDKSWEHLSKSKKKRVEEHVNDMLTYKRTAYSISKMLSRQYYCKDLEQIGYRKRESLVRKVEETLQRDQNGKQLLKSWGKKSWQKGEPRLGSYKKLACCQRKRR